MSCCFTDEPAHQELSHVWMGEQHLKEHGAPHNRPFQTGMQTANCKMAMAILFNNLQSLSRLRLDGV